ncbi:hypothetical protein [Demequina activiva]|uniref:hypothetical protein n=1 Tax=Demequina activiva TaxID=1582364 RepID=UPI001941170A|nr:hypothetical protein [Demequina activiva]
MASVIGLVLVFGLAWLSWRWGWVDPDPFATHRRVVGLRFSTLSLSVVGLALAYQFLTALGWVPVMWWTRTSEGRLVIASMLGRPGFTLMRLEVEVSDVVEFGVRPHRTLGWTRLLKRDHVVVVAGRRQLSVSSHGHLSAARAVLIHRELGGEATEVPLEPPRV